jgi:diguanylate cyclase (GGDEF)-like protein
MVKFPQSGHLAWTVLHYIKSNLLQVLLWPLICLALGSLLWFATYAKLNAEKETLLAQGLKDAKSLANGYAKQLNRSIEQVDQITLQVQYDWSKSQGQLKLEELVKAGLFPSSTLLRVLIVDRSGQLISATIPILRAMALDDRDYFIHHKQHASNALKVSLPTRGRLNDRSIIQFSRRLNAADGSFDGVVVVSADVSYFLSFYERSTLGENGLLAMVGEDGIVRASRVGGKVQEPQLTALKSVQDLLATPGPKILTCSKLADMEPRLTAWSRTDSYPMVAIVGLNLKEVLAPYRQSQATYRAFAFAGSVLLFLFAFVSAYQSLRLVRTRLESEKARAMYGISQEGSEEAFLLWRAIYDSEKEIVDFQIVDCNERAAAMYDVPKAKLVGKRFSTFYQPALFQRLLKTYRQAFQEGYYEDEYRIPPESPLKMAWLLRKIMRTKSGLALVLKDISEAKAYEERLLYRANHDLLTDLPNRQWLKNFLPDAMARAIADEYGLAVLFMDLDGFKAVNDSLGHSAGDELLRAAAHRLQSVLRPSDCVVRFGGDEFVVLLEPVARETKPARVAERIVEAFKGPFQLLSHRQTVGVSIGISMFPNDGSDGETLLRNADAAMYSVKSGGKSGYRFYQPELREHLTQQIVAERSLIEGLERKEFILYYQPRIKPATGEICGLEALARWNHPTKGLLSPAEFIPLAESTGHIVELGSQVIEQACWQLADWKQQGVKLVPISVNVAAQQFNQDTVLHTISECLKRYQIDPAFLDIELTESSMLAKHSEIESQLAELRAMGIKLLIDDFGTGYASLAQLLRLQMDVLKIDRSFTEQLGKTAQGKVFVKSIISLAHSLNMTVVAEGVEDRVQLDLLQALSCDEVQGYLISRPAPPDRIRTMLAEGRITIQAGTPT